METLTYKEAIDSLEAKLKETYEKYSISNPDLRYTVDLSLEEKQTLKEHFRDIVHSLDATGDQSKVSL